MGTPITHKPVLEKFGKNLQKARQDNGISQEQLAEKTSLHRTYIGLVERGERNPTVRTLYKICKTLKVSASDLLGF